MPKQLEESLSVASRLGQEARLAYPRLAGDKGSLPTPVSGLIDQPRERGEMGVSPNQDRA